MIVYAKCIIANTKIIQYKKGSDFQSGDDKNNIIEIPPITLKIRSKG